MDNTTFIHVLAAVRLASIARFRENLAQDPKLKVAMVTSPENARASLADTTKPTDVFVVDNGLGDMFELIKDVRQTYPRLLILLVDEDADFGMPGRADDVSTQPFKDNELIRKIKRLAEERRLETLRADALPPVRNFAKALRKATKGLGKQQAAVTAIKDLGYDHVAFYALVQGDQPSLSLGAQMGPNPVMSAMPNKTEVTGLLGWVIQNGQSKVVGPGETPNHFLVEKGRFGAAVCAPVGTTMRFGAIVAFREQPDSIRQENVVMLELVSAQLAASLAKDQRG